MKSTEFLAEGDDKNINDVQVNHPEIYKFLVNRVGSTALNKQSTVEAYNTADSHIVAVKIKPSPGIDNTEEGFRNDGIAYDSRNNRVGSKVLSGADGDMHWSVTNYGISGNITELWRFALPHADDKTAYHHDRTMEANDEPTQEKLDLRDVFGSDAGNVLRTVGIKTIEKPNYWSDLERKPLDELSFKRAQQALSKAGLKLPEYAAWEIYPIDPDRSSAYIRGPLQTVENMPTEKVFVIYDLPYSDELLHGTEPKIGTFLVDRQGATSYIRNWIMIK